MTQSITTQIIQQLKNRSNILIVVGNAYNLDSACAGLALRDFLVRQEKQATVLTTGETPNKLRFLPQTVNLKKESTLNKNLVVDINLSKRDISELRYQKLEDKLSIFVTAKEGEFNREDVNIQDSVYPYDLIICVGINNLEELGELYAKHAQLFFQTPVINIGVSPSNESYGQINLVNLVASANSEIVFDLLNEYDINFIDDNIATLILTGLIAATNSFQNVKTTPQIFTKASKLVGLGARQQEIVTQLYKTKSLGFLRLWGRMLARLKHDPENLLAYSQVNKSDIQKSEADLGDVEEIISEMRNQLQFAKTLIFLSEDENKTTVFISTSTPININKLFEVYNPTNLQQAVKLSIPKQLSDTEMEVIPKIKGELEKLKPTNP
jgi:nanoRNase/pAp phosphatase (c-di-AMP/oligoRNAs hydrolase)